jgi:hypothetical protein
VCFWFAIVIEARVMSFVLFRLVRQALKSQKLIKGDEDAQRI